MININLVNSFIFPNLLLNLGNDILSENTFKIYAKLRPYERTLNLNKMFAGIICLNDTLSLSNRLIELGQLPEGLAHIPYDNSDQWQHAEANHQITLVQQRHWNSARSKLTKGIASCQKTQTRIVAWARIDNRDELLAKLPQDLHYLCLADEGFILAAYLHWQDSACEHLVGDFAFAIYDNRDHSVYCGRDHTGVKPFYYYFDGKIFAFATSLAVLNQLPDLNLTLSEKWMAAYLLNDSADWQETTYEKIRKLPPAHILKFSNSEIKVSQYFEFSVKSDLILGSDEEYVEAYREILHQAVACRVQSDYPIGSESSGGLDSSTVTALAARYMQRPGRNLHTFGYDESELTSECIIAISQSHPMVMTHFASKTRGSASNLDALFYQCHGAPIEHPNGMSHHMFYEVSQKLGIRTLLSGFGGDEFVTNAAPVALVEFWRNKDLRLFFNRQRGKWLDKLPHTMRWLYLYYRHNNHSIISRGLKEGAINRWRSHILKTNIADKYHLKGRLVNEEVYDGGKASQNAFMLEDRWSPIMTARYENCTLMAARYGIDYRWPLMDIRLLKFFLSTPAAQKLGPSNMGRYLHRRAVADILPEFITWKQKDMEPFRFLERVGLWAKRTPLGTLFKKAAEPNLNKLTRENKVDKQTQLNLPELHPLLNNLVDKEKLDNIVRLLRNRSLTKDQRRLIGGHVRHLQKLNAWLHLSKFDSD